MKNIKEKLKKLLAWAMAHKKISIPAAAALLALLIFLFGGGGGVKTQVLDTATVRPGTVIKSLDATGIVTPEVGAIVKIGSRTNGIIENMYVRVGDAVTTGQIIAKIDSRELEAQVTEAEAAKIKADIEYERVLVSYPLQIAEARAQVASARASSDYQALNLKRRRQLVEQDLDSRDTLDVAQQQSVAATQTLLAAQATQRRLEEEFARQKESAAQAKKQAEASLATARIRLDYATITSPMDGVVSQVTAQEGETVISGLQVTNLITVMDPSRLEMWVYVDETDVGQVQPGMPVEFTVDSLPGKTFGGQVRLIYPEPEVRDSIVYYQTVVPLSKETALQLKAEMTTQCRVIVGSKQNVLTVPNEAVKWVGGEQVIFVVGRNNQVTPVRAELGMRGSAGSEVLSGLNDGDVVATRLIMGDDITSGIAVPASSSAARPMGGPGGGRR